jgi:hypothetical protein
MWRIVCVGVVAAAVVGLTSCGGKKGEGGGNVNEVSSGTLAGTSLTSHAGNPPQFQWSFTPSAFTIQAGAGPIPRELLDELVGEGRTASKIEGAWRVEGMSLVLSNVTADESSTGREGRMVAVQHEGKIRVTMPARSTDQFVFGQ